MMYKNKSSNGKRGLQDQHFIKAVFVLVFLMTFVFGKAQIKVPNMIVPNDSWGLIDANYLYGGCMQVDSHAKMLQTDVQFLKRGMLFVVYDDDDVTAGAQTKIYIFSPATSGPQSWAFNTPFDIPAASQNKTIATAGLRNFLYPLNISANTSGTTDKTAIYFDTTTRQFYRYDETTTPGTYVAIFPSSTYISVTPGGNITSTNVQSALEEISNNTNARYETSIATSGNVEFNNIGFKLQTNSMVYFNGALLENSQWTGVGTSKIILLVSTEKYDKLRIQK